LLKIFNVAQFKDVNTHFWLHLVNLRKQRLNSCYYTRFEVKVKGIPVTGHEGQLGCALAALYPQEDSWYSFLLEAESTPGP
jgi:hypothetical protein